jgi:hypothetical protein
MLWRRMQVLSSSSAIKIEGNKSIDYLVVGLTGAADLMPKLTTIGGNFASMFLIFLSAVIAAYVGFGCLRFG